MTEIKPNLKTPLEDLSSVEKSKISTQGLTFIIRDVNSPLNLPYLLRDTSIEDLGETAESLAKSYGIYLEFNRETSGNEKEWMYMLRVTVPGGGPLNQRQWDIIDDVAEKYTESDSYNGKKLPSLRLTTRQNIQLHWVKKKNLVDSVREIAESGFYTINGCGDNVRNVMACPLSAFSGVYNANAWAQKAGKYFRLPTAAFMEVFAINPNHLRQAGEVVLGEDDSAHFEYGKNLLNRKFKIGFSAIHHDEQSKTYKADNCVEMRTNDIGVAPILEGNKVSSFQVYLGGSQGEKSGYATFAASGQPFGIFEESELMKGLDAIVNVHKEWGDRQNRHWARLKYVIYKMGMDWYRKQVRERGVSFKAPIEDLDFGPREMHYGWTKQGEGTWCYGAFIETGRLIDSSPNGDLKKMVRYVMDNYAGMELLVTANQDLIFGNIGEDLKQRFESDLTRFGYGKRNGKEFSTLRKLSGACVGRDTCRLTYTDSEKFEPYLIDELEVKWGNLAESVGVTGCERQCFRPGTKTIGWVGSGLNMYWLRLGGSEDARNQGGPLLDPNTGDIYLKTVPRKDVPVVTDALFEFYISNRQSGRESEAGGMGYFIRRVGSRAVIEYLKKNPKTAHLMTRTVKNPLASQPLISNPSLVPVK
ncbi:MAG: nitrite/sulfite reductase [Nitrososphaerales archaeon]